ncbi:MAG: hypothetical protein QHC67_14590 [Sphingobium sp.]|uniref:hypothetical protein n=1 Tax=Sphingobium sp. TaxID=1912891 RepID=UPI0029BB521A|nr:hypothetical protein [Sphingobium sp.]MDX3911029.1 hypothetical protein [Sphingobium sp.]
MTMAIDPDDTPIVVELVACPASLPLPPLSPAGAPGEMTWRKDAWTPDEIATLRRLFADDVPVTEIAEVLGRGRQGVRDRIYVLGLRRHSQRAWNELEDEELIRRYGNEATAGIAADLGRSCMATYARAALLGLARTGAPPWTPWEDAQLRFGYETGIPIAEIAVLIGRSHCGVATRATLLGQRHKHMPRDWSPAEIERALALQEAGHSYTRIGKILGQEGHTTRSKSAMKAIMRKIGEGRGWGRAWTAEEDELLKAAYASGQSLTHLQRGLSRSAHSIRWRARYLGLTGTHANRAGWRTGPDWSEADLDRLRRDYGRMPTADLARDMGRSKAAIFTRANLLGLSHGYQRPWSEDDKAALAIAHARAIDIRDLADALGRKVAAVHKYAAKQGLAFGRRKRAATPKSLPEILALDAAAPASKGD